VHPEATPATEQGGGPPGPIDTDLHPHVGGGLGALVEFMPRNTRVRSASDAAMHETERPGSNPRRVAAEHMDRLGLSGAVLIPLESINGFTDPLTASVYSRALNQFLIEKWLPVDPRYHLALMVLPHDPAKAAREIRDHRNQPRVAGVYLPLLNILMGSSYYHPIYKRALEQGLPVIVHPAGPEGAYYGAPVVAGGVPATYLERHVALPQIAQANLSSLIMNGVFERFPGLKVVFAEFGFAWAVPLMWRLDMDWRRLRRETPWVRKPPSEYVRASVRFTMQPMEEAPLEQMQKLMRMLSADRTLMFSSDYPHWDRFDLAEVMAAVPPDYRARVSHETALETFPSMRLPAAV
jgi:uncharacterized protein